ncbi:hypothetical protein [Streptomyces sp. 8ZJF_21]|uniref:hypothetical protein n=1 Tax=Streptomyces sp. 8ZJF_21 TaxID=2903141 RepID=UPI001E28BE0F|nr:hypothetical protein [Streptomyces sp. 8ZJF_21]MCD9589950.1 hypothetical protein [Streptomyces sp. 8ZJF_21]
MELETAIGTAGLLVAIVAAALAWAPQRLASRERGTVLFVETRRHLRSHRAQLSAPCVERQAEHRADEALALLTRPGWVPARPLPLSAVRMTLREARPEEQPAVRCKELLRYWPHDSGSRPLESYSAAIEAFDRPGVWFNGPSYRLLEATPLSADRPGGPGDGLALDFTLGHYFDGLDTTESLAYEEALRHLKGGAKPLSGPYRRALTDPFALARRAALPGVSALTIRIDGGDAYFFLHRREAGKVAVAMDTTHVAPAGEFQPHADVLPVWQSDLDLWRTTMREYAEEFLGAADATGSGGVTVDYAHDAPYARFEEALRTGRVRVRFLALGLDPLSWKPEFCLVCVWDAAAFDEIFAAMSDRNEEGVLVVGTRAREGYRGIPFTEDNVLGYATHEDTLPAGRACLTLAWRWRRELELPVPG